MIIVTICIYKAMSKRQTMMKMKTAYLKIQKWW